MIEILSIPKIGEDERGSTHYFNTDRTGELIVGYRKKGSLSARHYHKGLATQKDPEIVILMSGEATVNWFDIDGDARGSDKLVAPVMLMVHKNTWHEVIADTDFVMLELNELAAGRMDTFQLESEIVTDRLKDVRI